ncbi:selenoprotein W-related protein [Erwinia sp. OLTSP20]|uniref:SelT/SelW/SelH family protein n=1 Tax=unclassified Erwinia TaxID=2622719 RepID=UPI000C19EFBE|nr:MULTISPECIES: SelT/SelW/SelH family protein [unclassified Erwinia]PIJ50346.1 selenoprotein W-related protein [Erwinia sp. OAMSP11]PIJ72072.1 selenoprotein W-related protein [Erwinia sp. OLSSP12]PIJ81363.1 selenoprotein W-related protein [Erwinia sp. OLCASP19]PIJ84069.1 selenoprotein W-related protein [Erwinia sp. OLMTSP26]PIJ85768.1 selenoprotein W-related protein [Erwinia sp. OLMDSP33]
MTTQPAITIRYCVQCNWLLRAAWIAQELPNSFADELASVTLKPATGGVYEITANQQLIWERKRDGGFPDAATLKQRLCALYFPDKAPAHGRESKTP